MISFQSYSSVQAFLLHLSLFTFVTNTGCLVNLSCHLPELLATDQVDISYSIYMMRNFFWNLNSVIVKEGTLHLILNNNEDTEAST